MIVGVFDNDEGTFGASNTLKRRAEIDTRRITVQA
jgi:hypothetical protein